MRKIFISIICALGCFTLAALPAFANSDALEVIWDSDYTDMTVTLSITSTARYIQQLSMAMYPASTAEPSFYDYCRMDEITVTPGEKALVKIAIDDDLDARDYKIRLQGNGYLSSVSKAILDVTILSPNAIKALLENINAETLSEGMLSLLESGKDALQLSFDKDDPNMDSIMAIFIKTRDIDYNGNFASLDDVRQVYANAGIIAYLKEPSASASELRNKVELNARLLNFDTSDEDYIANADVVYAKLLKEKDNYNGTGIQTCGQFVRAVKEMTAVEAINSSDMTGISDCIAKYYKTVGISDETYRKFIGYNNETKQKIFRRIYNETFNTCEAIRLVFTQAVNETSNTNDNHTSGGGGNSGGGSGKGGMTGGVTLGEDILTSEIQPVLPSFADCPETYWAFSYVNALSTAGIISGYEGNFFRPEQNVTREEFVKMIISAMGLYNKDAECAFEDVPKAEWFYKYVASANAAEIVNGISETVFGTGQSITREDVSVIAARMISILKADAFNEDHAESKFADAEAVSDYAVTSIALLNHLNIIDGFEDNTFRPKELLTRAQAAKIIYMLRELV